MNTQQGELFCCVVRCVDEIKFQFRFQYLVLALGSSSLGPRPPNELVCRGPKVNPEGET